MIHPGGDIQQGSIQSAYVKTLYVKNFCLLSAETLPMFSQRLHLQHNCYNL